MFKSVTRCGARIALFLLMVAGCGQGNPPTGTTQRFANAVKIRARADFHRLNPQDWVGVLHNKGVALLMEQFRQNRIHAGQVCKAIANFSFPDDSLPEQARGADKAAVRAGIRFSLGWAGCGRKANSTASPASFTKKNRPHRTELSAEAISLLNDISAAGDAATDASDLAQLLLPIVEAADELPDADETAVVQGNAAIAQSSAEYWEENFEAHRQSIGTWVEANCEGLSPAECEGGNGWQALAPGDRSRRLGALQFRFASVRRDCPQPNRRAVFIADIEGGIGGFLFGLWSGPGSLATAGAGAYSVSMAKFAAELITFWMCMLWPDEM